MKNHTTYYIIGGVLIVVGVYLYKKNKPSATTTINLNPPEEKQEPATPSLSTPPYMDAYNSLKALIESLKKGAINKTA